MESEKQIPIRKKSVLIVLVAGIGDLVLASPAIRAIRNGYPGAEIHLLTSTEAFPLARNYPYVDRTHSFPLREILEKKQPLSTAWKIVSQLRRVRFDMAVNLYSVDSRVGAVRMAALFLAFGAKERVGHDNLGFGLALTNKIPRDVFRGRHKMDSMLEVSIYAGGKPDDKGIEIFWEKASEEKWSQLFDGPRVGADEVRIGINPGGYRPNRRWEPRRFAAVADRLCDALNAKIFIFGGPGEEKITAAVVDEMKHDAVVLAGKLNLNDLAYIASHLDLMITNDSGPMHIAAAAGAPLVVIFGPSDPKIFGPRIPEERYDIVHANLDCQPCSKINCEHVTCLKEISPDDVFEAAIRKCRRKN